MMESSKVLQKIGDVIASIDEAKHVDDVIVALHSIALLLFPIDSSLFSGSINQISREKVIALKGPSDEERKDLWDAFYKGSAFAALARVLLHDVAVSWLDCFPTSARKDVYDVFFVDGLQSEVVETLVPCLRRNRSDQVEENCVCSNAERLLVLCLLENSGVLKMAKEFGVTVHATEVAQQQVKSLVSKASQLVASIPDKIRPKAPNALSAHSYFKEVTIQLLSCARELEMNMNEKEFTSNKIYSSSAFLFIGEVFSRICRRGSADILVSEIVSHICKHVQIFLSSNPHSAGPQALQSMPCSLFWSVIIDAMVDPYAVERLSEQLLHQLANDHSPDLETYWILWLLFHWSLRHKASIKSMFVNKFLLWKVFPLSCLRWILQVSVFECPPDVDQQKKITPSGLLDTLQHLVAVWSKQDFLQSSPVEQQAYVTAAIGLCMEKISKEQFDSNSDLLHSFLLGVRCRLDSPNYLIRRMASSVALVFSKVLDPLKPLYLDDSCRGDLIDWEFGMATREAVASINEKDSENAGSMGKKSRRVSRKLSEPKLMDPDEIVDLATLNDGFSSDENDEETASKNSDASNDSSLKPFDMADDDSDLRNSFSQLVDVVKALRKPEDPDGVERAIDVAEKLIRASPDELRHIAGDLARTLLQARCSDSSVEGEEESAELKRQRALSALLVTCPFESLDALHNLIYAPNIDASQRILILDVMSIAAQELAVARVVKPKHHQGSKLVSITSETQPWFLPRSAGPLGAGPWREISDSETPLNWSYKYERELPLKSNQVRKGKTRRWSMRSESSADTNVDVTQNRFPVYAAAFMLPVMRGFDKKRHGVDLLGQDFIILAKLINTLGICMKCAAMHPEALALAPGLLDMLSSREICHHAEAFVRKNVLFACSCILMALHPSHIASALAAENHEMSRGLDWIRSYALQVVESDIDKECYTVAMACLHLHSEMALQASRAMETVKTSSNTNILGLPPASTLSNSIIIPNSNVRY